MDSVSFVSWVDGGGIILECGLFSGFGGVQDGD